MCIRYILLCCCFSLAESALRWDQEPLNPTTAYEGKNVSLKWDYNLDGGTLDLVQWTQKESGLTIGRIIPPSSYSVKAKFRPRFTISETEEATLIITNVSRSDAGEIDCKVGDDEEEIISTIRLIVLYGPENISLHTSANVSATLRNSTVDFWCTADGNPAPHYKLSYNSTDLGENSSGTFQVRVTESGLYVCEANNSLGIGSASVHINVVDPATADVSSSPHHVVEGHNVTLQCKVTGSPPLSIKWTKVNESNVLSNSSKLTLYNVTRPGTSGEVLQYNCTAKNAYGDPASDVATIQVYYPAKVLTPAANTSIARVEGSDVVLVCTAEGSPTPHVTWFSPNGTRLKNGTTTGVNLTLTSVSRDDSGTYQCKVTNKVGSDVATINLNVLYPAKVLTPAANISITRVEGSDVVLVCTAEGNPTPHVTWFSPNGTRLKNGTTTGVNLTLTSVSRDDSGTYQCKVTNKVGSDVATINLNVLYPAKVLTPAANISITRVEGSDVVLVCTAEGNPTPHVTWFSPNGTRLKNGTTTGVNLTLTSVSRDDSGTYQCRVTNKVGSDVATINLNVLYPAKVLTPAANISITRVEGSDVVLVCTAEGNPTPHVTWFSPNGTRLKNGTTTGVNLTLTSVSREDRGTYQCKVTNKVGSDVATINLNVLYPAKVLTPAANISIARVEGSDVVLVCTAEGNPTPHVTWFSPNGTRLKNGTTTGVNLTLTSVSREDRGTYQCKVTNKVGSDVATINLNVLYPAKVLTPAANITITRVEGSDVALVCTAEGNPTPHVTWFSPNGTRLKNGTTTGVNLTLTSVSRDDSGTYQCKVTNKVGSDVATINLNVLFPAKVVKAEPLSRVVENRDVVLVCTTEGNPTPHVTLFSPNGTELKNGNTSVNFTLLSVSRDDNGTFRCNATNMLGNDSVTFNLNVLYKPKILSVMPNDTEVHEHESVHFVADVEGNPEPYVAWISPDGSVLSNKTMGFNYNKTNITRDEQGRYKCRVTNIVGTDQRSFTVTVLYPAKVVKPAGNISIARVEGSDVDLVCKAEGNPTPYVTLFSPNGTELKNGNTSVNYTLTSVSRDDSGTYQCEARNKFGSDVATIKLDVLFPAKVISARNLTAVEGVDAVLVCTTEGNPAPRVIWFSPNGIVLQNRTSNTNLALQNVSRDSSGTYRCDVTNEVGSDSKNVYLDVQFLDKMDLEEENVTAVEGNDAVLVCTTEGNPAPRVIWFSPSGTVLQNQTSDTNLTLRNVSRDYSGTYRCDVKNEVGSDSKNVHLDVQFFDKMDSQENVTSVEGSGAVLVCTAEGSPTPRVIWFSPSGTVLQNRTSNTNLTLRNVSRDNSGTYRCDVTNEVGSDSKNVHLDVQFPAKVVSAENVTSLEGHNAVLVCTAEGNPAPRVIWFSPNGTVLQNRTSDTNLTLRNVSRDYSGTYRCDVTNEVGSDSKNVYLDVQFPAKVVSAAEVTVVEGSDAVLVCTAEGNPAPRVIWFSPNGTVVQDRTSGTNLTLPNVRRHSSGNYLCNVTNRVASDSKSVRLDVQFFAKIVRTTENVTAVEGSTGVIVCTAEGNPTPQVAWIAPNGTVLQNRTSDTNLTLETINRNMSGTYRCNASNGLASSSVKVTLVVLYRPEILSVLHNNTNVTGKTMDVRENEDVHLEAVVEGNPVPYVAWISPNETILSNSTKRDFTITKIKRDEKKTYKCEVSNGIPNGTSVEFKINVEFGAEVALSSNYSDEYTILTCIGYGNPAPNVTIIRLTDGSEVVNKRKELVQIKVEKQGRYRCTSTNYINGSSKDATVTVIPDKHAEVKVKIKIKELFDKEFLNKLSQAYQSFIRRVIEQVVEVLQKEGVEILGINIHSLSPGSVLVDFTIFVRDVKEAGKVTSTLEKAISNGKLGTLVVDKNYLEIDAPTPTPKPSPLPLFVKIIIVIAAIVIVTILVIVLYCWCKKRRKCRNGSVQNVTEEEILRGSTNGNGAPLAMQNMGYANEGPSARDGSGYVQVENGPAPGAAEGNYAEVGKAGAAGGVPLVTYAAVDQSKNKKKKKKKGEKLEEDDVQGTATYAQVDKSKKKNGAAVPEENTYAAVDMSKKKKKRKDGELFYADLSEFSAQRGGLASVQISPPPTLGPVKVPPKYENTEYADISQFSSKKKEEPPAEGEEGQSEEQKPTAHAAGPDGGIVVKEQEASKDEQGQMEAKL